jgi:hypothetical protein
VRLPVKLLASEQRRAEGSKSDFLISEEQWALLKPLVLEHIKAAALDGHLRKLKGLSYVLWRWKEWAGEAVVKEWLAAELKAGGDVLWVLRLFLSTSRSDGEKVTFTRYIRLDWLSHFVDIDAAERLTRSCDIATLSQDDMRALRAFRQALKWRDEGKPPEYTGDRWDGANPLEEDS